MTLQEQCRIYDKILRAIESCKTEDQLAVARRLRDFAMELLGPARKKKGESFAQEAMCALQDSYEKMRRTLAPTTPPKIDWALQGGNNAYMEHLQRAAHMSGHWAG
jgi:hypothetical protein